MRTRLMAAAAIAPLMFACVQPAFAQTTISSNTNTPATTAGSGDITIGSGATLQPQNAGANAVTINSSNSVTNNGTVQTQNLSTVSGVTVAPGSFTGSISNAGTVNLTKDYTPSDSKNSDGIAEAPFAQGSTRYGVWIPQGAALNGAITSTGSITVQGNNSAGVLIDGTLNGALLTSGAVTVTGDNSFGVKTSGGTILGGVSLAGAVSVKGQNSVAVQTGDIGGSLSVYSSITATGYAVTSRVTGTQALQNIENTPTDVEKAGAGLAIMGNVGGGVLLGGPPLGTVSTDATTDADEDGVVDSNEGTSSITVYGNQPALLIGNPNRAIAIGQFGTNDLTSYGLIIRGIVSAQGVFDSVTATAADIGSGGQGVTIAGGISIPGELQAVTFQAPATALHIETGVSTPLLQVITGNVTTGVGLGIINATVTTAGADLATGLQIDAGANVPTLTNDGSISAVVTGNAGNATAVVDNSGTITTVNNSGAIVASLNPTLAGETLTGRGVALDLRANTAGVTLNQTQGVGPNIIGDVLLSPTGPNAVNMSTGSITGTLNLGSGPSSLLIAGGSTFTGNLLYSGASLGIDVPGGNLIDHSATTVGATHLAVGAGSTLSVALDPAAGKSTEFIVSGSASFASTAKIAATLNSVPSLTGQTFTIVKANALTIGSGAALLADLPYLFNGSLQADANAGTIAITVAPKTPAEMALNKAETQGFGGIYAALSHDAGVETAIASATSRPAFVSTYDQLLPNSSGDVFETALNMSRAVSRATGDRFTLPKPLDEDDDDDGVRDGFWASEFYSGIDQQKQENNAYHSAALAVIGGYDFGGTGFTIAGGSSNVVSPHTQGASLDSVSLVEGGLYAAPRFGPLSIDARVGAGYLKVADHRNLVVQVVSGDLSTVNTITRNAEGDWNGYDLAAHLGASLQWDVTRRLFLQPKVYADVFHLHEDGYSERNQTNSSITDGLGYDYIVAQRNSTQTNGVVSLVTGMKFGKNFIFTPQLELGYDSVVSGGAGDTTARFAYTGAQDFTVSANRVGGAGMARLTLKGDGEYVHFNLQAGGEYNNDYRAVDLKAVFRLTF